MRATLDARSHGRRSSRLRTATNLDKQGGRATVYRCICPVSRESTNSACFKPELTILTRAAPHSVKLAEWARRNGVHPQTAFRWFREGTMPVPARRLASGTIMAEVAGDAQQSQVVVYARGSSGDQRADLDRQAARVTAGAPGGA